MKMLYFFFCTLGMSVAATVANIKIRYDAKTPQFAIFGTCVICVFYSIIPVAFGKVDPFASDVILYGWEFCKVSPWLLSNYLEETNLIWRKPYIACM